MKTNFEQVVIAGFIFVVLIIATLSILLNSVYKKNNSIEDRMTAMEVRMQSVEMSQASGTIPFDRVDFTATSSQDAFVNKVYVSSLIINDAIMQQEKK